jgi:RHS repeat-associated protein
MFDKDFGYLDVGFVQVDGAPNTYDSLTNSKTIKKNGYIYVYVSNESDNAFDVFFDDLSITHTKGKVIQEDHYYPFGLSINALSSTAPLSKPNKYKFGGKEEEIDFDIDWYNFGARMLDPTIGRWNGIDPYADIYESISPYSYVENNPITGIDPDGRLVVYVNGFRPGAYGAWLFSANSILGNSPPHEWHSPNWYQDDQLNYWGSNFGNSWGFQTTATEASYFVDGSNHAFSTADDRFSKGETEGRILAQKLESGEITIEDGEFIKLVGHSMGGAHAMGIAQGLLNAGVDPSIIKVFLFAPHQPNQIRGLDGVEVFQVGRDGDEVSSDGIISSATGSKHARVRGADWVVAPDRKDEERGGHYIQTFTASEFKAAAPRLFQYLIDAGYIKPDGTLVNDN